MNLLFLTPQLPHPPRQGTAIRNWGLIKSLSAKHAITLLTFADINEAMTTELIKTCQRIETVLPPARTPLGRLQTLFTSSLPDLAQRLESSEFSRRLSQLLQQVSFGAVFIEGLELARYGDTIKVRKIYDAHNCETVLQRRAFETDLRNPGRWPMALYSFIQSRRLAHFEARTLNQVTHVTCVSAEDSTALRHLAATVNPIIVANGIFLEDYDQSTRSVQSPKPKTPQLVFTGKMDYRPNVDAVTWFANDILPLVQSEKPDVQFLIVGQKPTEAVQRLARRPGVTVTGAVDDTRGYIANAAAYVAPLRMGGGTRFKLLEAMALRSPIVSTTVGAEGFPVTNGKEILLADSPVDFAQAVLKILNDEQQRQSLTDASYEFVKGYDWGQIVPKIEALLDVA
jgi:sugar transferase (PEP-CTERM/EpsH1 system associated)